jgi:hypothetical protein
MTREKIKSKIEKLKQELADLKTTNLSLWEMYGSELCVGSMLDEEKSIENKIKNLEHLELKLFPEKV